MADANAGTSITALQATSVPRRIGPDYPAMQMHGSCASRSGDGVLLIGPPGAGKSDLLLRLLARGFDLIADDRVEIDEGMGRAPPSLEGLLEVRGLGVFRLPHTAAARLALVVELGDPGPRLPAPSNHPALGLPLVRIDPWSVSAPERIMLALDCATGRVSQVAGAFAP